MSEDDRTIPQIDAEISHYQGKIEASRSAHEPNIPEPKDTLFEHDRDAELTKKLGAVWDKSEARSAAADDRTTVPSIKPPGKDQYGNPTPGDSLDEAFSKTYDFLHAPKAEQQTQRDAHKLVEQVRANAAKFSVTLDDAQAMEAAMKLEETLLQQAKAEAADPWQPAAAEIQKYYPNEQPAAIAAEYARLEGRFRTDPVAGFSEMARGIGADPVRLAYEVIQRAQQPSAVDQQAAFNSVYGTVNSMAQGLPRYQELESDMLAIAQSDGFKKTGDVAADFKRLYQQADKKNRQRSSSDRLGRSMEAVYDRKAGRK